MSNKKVLVLGAGGFVGGHLAKRLKSEGCFVRAVDIKETPSFQNIEDICSEYVCLDLRDPKQTSTCMLAPGQVSLDDSENAFDEVYNLAADMGGAGYIFSGDNDFQVMTNSAKINISVIDNCIKFNVKRVFFSSSACVYPEHNQLDPDNPITKEDSAYPADPDSEYGWEKLFSERSYLSAYRNKGLEVRVARYHNVYGPNCSWNDGKEKAPAAMCRKVVESDDIVEVWGDGKQTRSFLYIEDALDATIAFMRQDKHLGPVNIGSEQMVTINGLVNTVMNVSGKKLKIKHIDGPLGVRGRSSDNTLIRKIIGWDPAYNLAEGIALTYDWIKKQVG